MRRIIWSSKAQKDYAKIIDYLLIEWTLKEVQKFVEQIEDTISILELNTKNSSSKGSRAVFFHLFTPVAIKTILDFNRKEPYIELTKDQALELLTASKEGEKGNFKSQSEMDKKVEEWLREK